MKEKFNLLAMLIDLAEIGNSPREFDFSLAPENVDLGDEGVKLLGPVHVRGEIRKGSAQTDVSGRIEAAVALECTRCLAAVEGRREIPFAVSLVAPEHETRAKEAEIGVADLDSSVLEGQTIDLGEIVREQIVLDLPEQVFCRADCRGLCEKCGADRNLIDCNCEEQETDPRWQALRGLKIK